MRATAKQIRAIQTARRSAGLAEDGVYRDALRGFGVVSSKELTIDQAAAFLDRLNRASTGSERPESRRATGPFAGKLRALWISAWNLGVVRDRDDVAMMHFVERQTGVPHTRFLQDPAEASKAIEAMKAMLVRDGGVDWPKNKGRASIELKRAIVRAQGRRLHDLRALTDADLALLHLVAIPDHFNSAAEIDDVSRRLGMTLRKTLERAAS